MYSAPGEPFGGGGAAPVPGGEARELKPLRRSRTLAGVGMAVLGMLPTLAQTVLDVAREYGPQVVTVATQARSVWPGWERLAGLLIVVCALVVVAYARIDDRRKGLR